MTGYEALANAVIEMAAVDYMKALCDYHKYQSKYYLYEVRSLERFFKGDTFKMYTTLDGKTLMRQIKEHVEAHNYEMSNIKRLVDLEIGELEET